MQILNAWTWFILLTSKKNFFLNQDKRNSSNSAVTSNTLKIVASFSDLMACSVVQKRKFGGVAFPKPFSSPTWFCLHGRQEWEAPGGVCLAALRLMHYLAQSSVLICQYFLVLTVWACLSWQQQNSFSVFLPSLHSQENRWGLAVICWKRERSHLMMSFHERWNEVEV